MKEITSNQNPVFKSARQLHSSRGRKKLQRMIVFGWRETSRAIRQGIVVQEVFVLPSLLEQNVLEQIEELSKQHGFQVCALSEELFAKLQYGNRSDGVIATADRPAQTFDDIPRNEEALVIVAVGLEKPGNLGAIFRSADGAGVTAILVADALTDVYHPNSIRASMGTVFSIPSVNTTSSESTNWLATNGFQLVVADASANQELFDVGLTGRTAIALGNEAFGLPPIWKEKAAIAVKLPMLGIADSLNVSVSAAVVAYEAYRQRR